MNLFWSIESSSSSVWKLVFFILRICIFSSMNFSLFASALIRLTDIGWPGNSGLFVITLSLKPMSNPILRSGFKFLQLILLKRFYYKAGEMHWLLEKWIETTLFALLNADPIFQIMYSVRFVDVKSKWMSYLFFFMNVRISSTKSSLWSLRSCCAFSFFNALSYSSIDMNSFFFIPGLYSYVSFI